MARKKNNKKKHSKRLKQKLKKQAAEQALIDSFAHIDAWDKIHTKLSQTIMGNGLFDAHMWLEDEDGNVIDYTDSQLSSYSPLGTKDIVRVPYPEPLQTQLKNLMVKDAYLFCSIVAPSCFEKTINTLGNCSRRSYILQKRSPNLKMVVGALGFRQKDGRVFYECG